MRDGLQGDRMMVLESMETSGYDTPSPTCCVLIYLLGDLGTHHLRKCQVVKCQNIVIRQTQD